MALAACVPAWGEAPVPVNVVPLSVRTPRSGFNRLVVNVTVCVPGTNRCATIDDVMVDTGSTGLRLESSAVPPGLELPVFSGSRGEPLAECLHFIHDDAWGPLYRADLHLGGMTAPNLPLQIIADAGRAQPGACPTSAGKPTSNGTLGIGPNLFDCQGSCEQSQSRPGVFVEEGGAWSPLQGPVPPASRLPNPVSLLPGYDDGVVFDLPLPPHGGSSEVIGTLTFGLGPAPNNRLGAANIIRLDGRGVFTTIYGGASYPASSIDSGTETYLLPDQDLPRCIGMTWAFCVTPQRTLDAIMVGADHMPVRVTFEVGDYRGALERGVGAWQGFAEASDATPATFVWGAPFFLGRRIEVVLDGKAVPGTTVTGPAYGIR